MLYSRGLRPAVMHPVVFRRVVRDAYIRTLEEGNTFSFLPFLVAVAHVAAHHVAHGFSVNMIQLH
jgi:hypothetical protein